MQTDDGHQRPLWNNTTKVNLHFQPILSHDFVVCGSLANQVVAIAIHQSCVHIKELVFVQPWGVNKISPTWKYIM